MIPINYFLAFFGLLVASYTDIKTHEVPDWLNYSMITLGFGIAVIYSLILKSFNPVIYSVLGFALCFVIAMIFYKAGQWGGGDAKMAMGLGALIGLNYNSSVPLILILLLDIFIVGAFYGFFYSIVLAIKHWSDFKKQFIKIVRLPKILVFSKIVLVVSVFGITSLLFLDAFLRVVMVSILAVIFFVFYFAVYSKAVEKSCMQKKVLVEKLTEGDWVLEPRVSKGKIVYKPNKEGIEMNDIKKLLDLKLNKCKVLIREGIPFLPSFLLAFILLLIFGNWFVYLI